MITPWGRKRNLPTNLHRAGLYIDQRNQDHIVYNDKAGNTGIRLIPNYTHGIAYR